MASFFSSDWHLDHANVIRFDNRPFKSISHMNRALIDNFVATVNEGDDFYFLGDFSFSRRDRDIEAHLDEMQGPNMYFLRGNHDHTRTIKLYEKYGTFLGNMEEIVVEGQSITLCHYSMQVWNKSHHGSWHLYGHSHHSLPDNPNSLSFDVGINGNGYNYKPLSFKQVKAIMAKKTYKPIDHHGTRPGDTK